jgi:neutral ceramidase
MNVGAAEIDITPDFPVELSGFALRPQPSSGVEDPIFARAIYLEQDGEKLLWIACDVIAFERDLVASFRSWAGNAMGLESRQVLLSATHTHTAPATIHLTAAGKYSVRYAALLSKKLREVARRATAAPDPCELVSLQTPLELSIDRRSTPTAHVDPFVSALAWRRRDDRGYIAACVNYAMHPVSFGRDFNRISADWCGSASGTVSQALEGSPITLVSNGAAGNINPPEMGISGEKVGAMGRRLGNAVVAGLRSAKPQAAEKLRVRSMTVELPLDHLDAAGIDRVADERLKNHPPDWVLAEPIRDAVATWRETMKKIVSTGGGKVVPFEIQAIRLGDQTIVAVSGEMFSRFTQMLRERMSRNLFVVGYANAAFGYIPTSAAYDEGGYEVETAHFFYNSFRPARGALEMLVDRAVELIERM